MKVRVWLSLACITGASGILAAQQVVVRSASQVTTGGAELPLGVSPALYRATLPSGAGPTAERIALGEKLFRDQRLSADGTVSCATCHIPEKAFVDHKRTSEGIRGQRGQRNSPTVLNAMFNATQFWDGRARTLEDQAKLPILNPIEMGQPDPDAVVGRLRGLPEYAQIFSRIYGREITYDDLADAIASFERSQYAGDAPFDRYLAGDERAIDTSAKRGWALFNGKARCTECHAFNAIAPLFSDQKFHNIGIAAHKQDFATLAREALKTVRSGDQKQIDELAIQTRFSELGRFLVTKQANDVGAFKTPTLRNVGVTEPYMHDGSLATLWDVIDHYNKGGAPNPFLDGGMQRLGLTEREIDDLVAFLFTLTSDRFAALNEEQRRVQAAKRNFRPERDTAVALGKRGDMGDLAPNPDAKNPSTLGFVGPVR
ncbi:MAG TPA: cytochrome c peroxidase [Myxococcales bacterium]|nr:cytochrome c peroxidase [Myxococcales bacterium]